MNPVPFFLRFVGGWQWIRRDLIQVGYRQQLVPYDQDPMRYRFDGWGSVGFPPRLACNVTYYGKDGQTLDMGRFIAGQRNEAL